MDAHGNHAEQRHQCCHILITLQAAKTRCCQNVRGVGSKGAMLVIAWTSLVYFSVINPVYYDLFSLDPPCLIGLCVVVLIGPVAGLLASIYLGRYRALSAGVWLIWVGNTITVPLYILQWFLPESFHHLYKSGFSLGATGASIGFTLYLVTAVPFGLDQMPDGSAEQISAFLHWYTWATFVGLVTAFTGSTLLHCKHIHSSVQSLMSVIFISIALCSMFLQQHKLIIEPKGKNPFKTFSGVLRFAAHHKIPVRRSAFTYWEGDRPSRIDLAKSKYGGPYTNEEVEDVKTYLRMSLVIACFGILIVTTSACRMSLLVAIRTEFTYSNEVFRCPELLRSSAGYISSLLLVLGLPVYELFIYRWVWKWIPTTLKRVGASQSLVIVASLVMLVSTTVWYMYANPTVCIFTSKTSCTPLPLDHNYIEVPLDTLVNISFFLIHIAILEFVCAQAPYVIKGLLIGLVYSVSLSSFILGIGVYAAWKMVFQSTVLNSPGCAVWYYLFTTITTTLACVLWSFVAKWYRKRERDEPEMYRIFAENYYDH